MPNILAIETSFPAASIALQRDGHAPISQIFESHRQQNQLLFPPLEELLSSLDDEESLDLIIIGTGPGSYSGTRISIAAAQGIAAVHSCPVIGLSSLLGTSDQLGSADRMAVGDARRGSFYIANILKGDLPQEPELFDREIFDSKIASTEAEIFSLEAEMTNAQGAPITQFHSTAENLIHAWNALNESQQKQLLNTPPSPTYLRAPFITKAKPGHPLLRGKTKPS